MGFARHYLSTEEEISFKHGKLDQRALYRALSSRKGLPLQYTQ